MSKIQEVMTTGIVKEALSRDWYRVTLNDVDIDVRAYISGQMRRNQIRVLVGDTVEIHIPAQEQKADTMITGRIYFRGKKERKPHA
jgi:translation initiation factor IF-1